ncbi:MAG TPA: bacteriohopanetetrol glucosamine biosynthesis glycosyltransferase HpnI [Stellaceae bacterium]|nr:bacteriohopanetetrol glucosamine biosynthesis glycosyltransferase HpnI [Stellaceae bacterium]
MAGTLAAAIDGACTILGIAGLAYLALAIWCVRRFRSASAPGLPSDPPPLTVLKPLCGDEPRLYECLRSFCIQDYPGMQLVCGLSAADDEAALIVRRLMREFPDLDIRLVADDRAHGSNRKVSNLINMMAQAKHDLLVVSDSDVKIEGAEFLRRVAEMLADGAIGAVTCPYRGLPEAGIANALGALLIDDWYFPQALIARRLGPVESCFGPVTALRRAALERIGGFEALANQLADDHMLGQLIAASGYRVVLGGAVAGTVVAEDLRSLMRRELRWSRTIRATQPVGHFGGIVTHALPIVAGLGALRPSAATGLLVLALLVLRLALRRLVHGRLQQGGPAHGWLVPLRDALCLAVWMASYIGRGVVWRGQVFAIAKNGALIARGRSLPFRPLARASAR